jgi:hypothetical protein
MKQGGRNEGVLWILIGGAISILSWRIDLGSFREPGPGFVAVASGISLVVIGVIMTLQKTFSTGVSDTGPGSSRPLLHRQSLRLVYTLGLLAGYGLVLETLGYIVTTSLLMFGLFYDRGANRFVPSVLASVLTVGLTYLVFDTWLRVQLPRGILPWW